MKNRYSGIIWLMWCMVLLLLFGVLGNRGASAAVDSYTKLLIHGDSISDTTGKTITAYGDAAVSNAGKTVTANGNAQIDTAQSKFDGTSGLFDGSGDYLSIPDSDDWNFGTGDFTIDFWVRWNNLPAIGNRQHVIQHRTDDSNYWSLVVTNSSGLYSLEITVWSGGSEIISTYFQTTALTTGNWYHIAGVRNNLNFKWFLNGVSQTTIGNDVDSIPSFSGVLTIGYGRHWHGVDTYVDGYLDELRISKGVARWTSDFTPPTEAYTSDNCTKLLLHLNGSDGSTSFIDSSRDHFKGKAIAFDGSGDYLSIPDSDDWNLGTGDFTIDTWVRFNNLPITIAQLVFEQRQDSSNVMFFARGGGVWNFYLTIAFVTQIDFTCTSTVVARILGIILS